MVLTVYLELPKYLLIQLQYKQAFKKGGTQKRFYQKIVVVLDFEALKTMWANKECKGKVFHCAREYDTFVFPKGGKAVNMSFR